MRNMRKDIQTMSKKQLALTFTTILIIEFMLATISFILLPWLGLALAVAGNATLFYGAYMLLKKPSQKD